MLKATQPHVTPVTLSNMRYLGVQRLVATCLNDACRHRGLINPSQYSADTEVSSFASKIVCTKCGAHGAGNNGTGVSIFDRNKSGRSKSRGVSLSFGRRLEDAGG
jgi:hypothetical protein